MKKCVVVTGGLGFIGSNLVIHLIRLKYFVIIVDKKTYSSNILNLKGIHKSKFKIFKCDINNKKTILKILKKFHPSAIFNLAAETHVDRSIDNPEGFIKSNINGVFVLLQQVKIFLKQTKKKFKFIHISTDEVYGDIKNDKVSSENDSYNPSSPYAASKAASDHLIKSYFRTYKLPVIVTNCCNNYGPRQFPEKLIPKMILNLSNGKNLPIYGRGINEREWIHVDDHCRALINIFKRGKLGESYNIGSGQVLSNNEIAKLLLKIFNENIKKIKSKIIYIKDRPGHDLRYALSSKKIIRLGWRKKINLMKGLFSTIKWYLENPNWIRSLDKKQYINRIGLKN